MKIILFILFGCLLNASYAISQDDTLQKYTYLMGGFKTIDNEAKFIHIGSCFFVRHNGLFLLVTAKHNITGINTFDKSSSGKNYDTIAFRYFNIDSNKYCIHNIDIKSTRDHLLNKYYYEDPDLVIIATFGKDLEKSIYSIEDILFRNYNSIENNRKLLCYGFGTDSPKDFKIDTPPIYYEG